MWVKICANTNLEDAVLAAELGADAVGFVFAQSKRQVTVGQVAAISTGLPSGVERIGVFDFHDADEIGEAAATSHLTAVQLHRGYDEALLAKLSNLLPDVEIIPTLHWTVDPTECGSGDQVSSQLERIAATGLVQRVLIDSKANGVSGGTGVSFDWRSAQRVFSAAPQSLQIILAGGLRPENVAEAVLELRPWGVDVASGVEASVGRKDPARMAAFIQEARSGGKT